MHPTVYALKALLQEQKSYREISMYIDLHGHSRKYNIFMYGVEEKKKPNPKVRAFPKFFSLHNHGKKYVSYNDCSFHVRKGRESTARVVVAREIGIPLSYTIEATFCGTDDGPLKYCHMHIGHLQEVGSSMCDAFLQYSITEGDVHESALTIARTMRASEVISSDALSDAVNAQLGGSTSTKASPMSSRNGSTSALSISGGYATLKNSSESRGDSREDSRPPSGSDYGVAKESETDLTCEDRGGTPVESDSDIVTGDDEDSDGGDSVAEDRYSADDGSESKSSRGPMLSSRDIKSATTSRVPSFNEARGRSDTAPIVMPMNDSGGSRRLLARDDGFSFSDSVVANRMIVGIAASAAAKSLQSQKMFSASGEQK
jgi:hypothetical protein